VELIDAFGGLRVGRSLALQRPLQLGVPLLEVGDALVELAPLADEQVAATGSVEVAVLLRQALRLLGRS